MQIIELLQKKGGRGTEAKSIERKIMLPVSSVCECGLVLQLYIALPALNSTELLM